MANIEQRMEILELVMVDINNYNSETFGIDKESFEREINGVLGKQYFHQFLPIYTEYDEIDPRALAEAERRTAAVKVRVQQDSRYTKLLEAYKANDQETVGDLASVVFEGIERIEPGKIYHGIRLDEGMSVERYIELVFGIKDEGILPTEHGLHTAMDNNIRPVYCAENIEDTHGIICLAFDPSSYAVFKNGSVNEVLIYTPKLITDSEIIEKARDQIERAPQGVPDFDGDGLDSYLRGIPAELHAMEVMRID